MALAVGSRLGHYDVTALIGEGGMGQVYQATDTKLNRQVALKILPEAFATDPDRLARFQREAQVLASLNHPGIAAIYGIEEQDDTRALVLELVEGPTLADRIAHGAIPVDEALLIAKQIAEALEAAHEAGVIHRDLKPANIKVREDGTVKVLDFGLAKALDPNPTGDPSQSPTLTAAATQMGVIMGTAAYMSPEQARGKPVDKRADIWAFGCVLYEMLTGQMAFHGEDVSLTLASVMKSDVNVKRLPDDIPTTVRTVLRRCLEKNPSKRIRDIGDVQLAMEGAFETAVPAPSDPTAAPTLAVWQRPAAIAASVAVALVIGGFAVWTLLRPFPQPVVRLTIPFDDGRRLPLDPGQGFALSPDGQQLVYAALNEDSQQQIFVRSLDQFEARPLRGTEGGQDVFWSPDGGSVGFRADGSLKKVALAGGIPETLCVAAPRGGASWGLDDTIVFSNGAGSSLFRVSAFGGDPEPLTSLRPEGSEFAHVAPQILPGGAAVLFTIARSSDDSSIAVQSPSAEEPRVLLVGRHARFVPTGHLVFVRQNTMWIAPFDLDRLEVTGPASPILDGVATTGVLPSWPQFTFARDGSLVYAAGRLGEDVSTLVWVDRDGQEIALAAEPADYNYPRISPDGTRVTVGRGDQQQNDLWIWDLSTETPTRLTFDVESDIYGEWTPNGERVVFSSARDGATALFWKTADFTGGVDRLTETEVSQFPQAIAPNGSVVVFRESPTLVGSSNLKTVSLTGEPVIEDLLSTEFDELNAAISPNGRWFAYQSDASGQFEIYVRAFPDADSAPQRQISTSGGKQPAWGPDGDELFYVNDDRLFAVEIEMEPTYSRGTPTPIIDGGYLMDLTGRTYDVDPLTGDRFLMVKPGGDDGPATTSLNVVQHWFEELTRLVPTN